MAGDTCHPTCPACPALLDRTSQKGHKDSVCCPADSASQRAAGSKVQALQLAWLGSGGHSQEHGLLSVFSRHSPPAPTGSLS